MVAARGNGLGRRRGALAIVVVAAACSSSSPKAAAPTSVSPTSAPPAPSTTAATTCARPHAAGQFSETFDYLGVHRTYQLYVPSAYRGTPGVPVVFNFYGFGSNAIEQMAYGNFKPPADRNDF